MAARGYRVRFASEVADLHLARRAVRGSAFGGGGLQEQRGGELPGLARRHGNLDGILAAGWVADVEADSRAGLFGFAGGSPADPHVPAVCGPEKRCVIA